MSAARKHESAWWRTVGFLVAFLGLGIAFAQSGIPPTPTAWMIGLTLGFVAPLAGREIRKDWREGWEPVWGAGVRLPDLMPIAALFCLLCAFWASLLN